MSKLKTQKNIINNRSQGSFGFGLLNFGFPRKVSFVKDTFRGFTLLIAVVISSLLLSIGLAILNSTLKGFELSVLGRESQFAFYAADSGLECAIYWDVKEEAFATSSESILPVSGVVCAGVDITSSLAPDSSDAISAITTFDLPYAGSSYCAKIKVTKNIDAYKKTVIESRGYNSCDPGNTKRVERAIKISYD